MITVNLPRTGQAPLVIEGAAIAMSVQSQTTDGKRFLNLSVYRVGGGYAFSVGYHSAWKQEVPHDSACLCADYDHLSAMLLEVRPTEWVRGYPHGAQFARRQHELLAEIDQRWAAMVTQVLTSLKQGGCNGHADVHAK